MLVMETVCIAQIELKQSFVPSPRGGRGTCLAGAPHRDAEQLWELWAGATEGKSCCVQALLPVFRAGL